MDFSNNRALRLDDLMPLIQAKFNMGGSVRFDPNGTSMYPMLRQGRDSVLLSPISRKIRKYDLPLYRRANGQYVLHRVVGVNKKSRTYTCIGDNQFVLERGITREQMIDVVTVFWRDGKMIRTDSRAHRTYCRLWHYSRPIRRFWRMIVTPLHKLLHQKRSSD